MMSNEEDTLKKVYSPFSQKLTYDDFKTKLDSLRTNKWKFIRAVSLYQQSVKCSKCSPDVGMILLISCSDALQLVDEEKTWQNIKKFYLDYCPKELRDSPIKCSPDRKEPAQIAPFEMSIRYIYKKFRCLYVHEGKARLSIPKEVEDEEKPHHLSCYLTDKIKDEKDIYSIDLINVGAWFEKITFESLYAILTTPK